MIVGVADPQDIIDIEGVTQPNPVRRREGGGAQGQRRPWLSVWFRCCSAYGRIYRNASGSKYEGNCPRCGARVRALIGPGGTSRRMFETR